MEDGWKTIWDYRNGMILSYRVRKALDAGQLVIVPDGESIDRLKLVVLDEFILDRYPVGCGPKYRDLNHTKLPFKTKARPLKRYLYFLCLISLFSWHRFSWTGGSET